MIYEKGLYFDGTDLFFMTVYCKIFPFDVKLRKRREVWITEI